MLQESLLIGTRQKRFTGASRTVLAFIVVILYAIAGGPAAGEVRIYYDADKRLEPDDPALGLGFWSVRSGEASFADPGKGPLLTVDDEATDERAGGGRYYRRKFTEEEFNDKTDLRIEVTLKVLRSVASPASTCVQFTTAEGKTFGLGFLSDEEKVILYADSGEPLQPFGQHHNTDWLWQPAVLGSYPMPVDVKRTYVLELLRQGPDPSDDILRLGVEGTHRKPLTARLADLNMRVTVPGLVFGHPVNRGAGKAEWHRLAVTTTGKAGPPELPRRVGNKRQLFLDDWIVEKTENLNRRIEKPTKYSGNPVMRRDQPWDASRCDLYGSAVWEPQGRKLQLFYSAVSMVEQHDDRVAYAESRDGGRTWVKPELGLIPFGEHEKTNLVLEPCCQTLMGPGVFRDQHDCDPSRRYKLLASDYVERLDGRPCAPGIYVASSPDGIHWPASKYKRVLPLISDTAHCVFWDERIGRYVGYLRKKPKEYGRSVARTESDDFEHWTPPELCFITSRYSFYSMGVTPYQDIYIGTPWILWRKCKDIERHDPVISPGLAVSRDGWGWRMVTSLEDREEYIPTGPPGGMDDRQIRMSSSLVVLDDRILFIYGQTDRPHIKDMRVEVGFATLRLDGFAAMVAGKKAGRLLTTPFVLEGNRLYINAACDKHGSITVAALDGNGKLLPGFEHEKCRPVRGDGLKLPVTWRGHANFAQQRGNAVRLEFVMRKARLYSLWCED